MDVNYADFSKVFDKIQDIVPCVWTMQEAFKIQDIVSFKPFKLCSMDSRLMTMDQALESPKNQT